MSSGAFVRLARLVVVALAAQAQPAFAQDDDDTPEPVDSAPLPPPRIEELEPTSPQPSLDVALVLSGCGVGDERVWQVTRFCMAALGDVLFSRTRETEAGFGAYTQVATAGFADVRAGGGLVAVVPMIDWFGTSVRAGGFVSAGRGAVAPGAEGFLELGHRSVSHRSRYSISHALVTGMQYTFENAGLPQEHVLWIGVRLDAIWLTAPLALLR